MTAKPEFSVLINSYNYGRYIEGAIESVLAQTFPIGGIEIIVVDDGSTDDTSDRLKKYGDRIVCISKENGGQASAFNAGIAVAKGGIIAFLDADDFWHPSKLEEVSGEFRNSPETDFVYHYMDVVDDSHGLVDRYIFPEPDQHNYRDCYLNGRLPWFSPTSGMSVRLDCLRRLGPLPEDFRIGADLYLHYLLPFHARRLSLIKKPLGCCRLHGDNLSGGNLMTIEKLTREKDILMRIVEYVESESRRSGHDCRLLIKRMMSAAETYEIYIMGLQGKKIQALKEVLLFRGFLPGVTMPQRVARRLSMVVSVLVPPRLHLWLQRKYRKAWRALCLTG